MNLCYADGAKEVTAAAGIRCPAVTVTMEASHYMSEACRNTRNLVAAHPVKQDLFPKFMAAQAWPLVAPLYNGIEQALKMLLLTPSDPRFTLKKPRDLPEGTDLKNLKNRPYGHNLEALYDELSDDDRDHIELHFGEHWSLYGYDTRGANITTAEQFIAHINGPSRVGFFAWRYFLIDETVELPVVSLLTMSEIWDATCCCIKKEVSNEQDDCYRLSRRCAHELLDLINDMLERYPAQHEVDAWLTHRNGDGLEAWIDLLVKAHWDSMHTVQASDRLRPELAKMAHRALEQMAGDSADPDEAMLLHRIQAEPDFAWDPFDGTFR